jgi:hypothetical protein
MNEGIEFAAADRDFYRPLAEADDDGEVFTPPSVPQGWRADSTGLWTMWFRPGRADLADQGWKVHVSARPDRLAEVLQKAAAVCFAHGVPFKHLSRRQFYWWTHHKYAHRPQAGKFIAAYPRDVAAARALMEELRTELAGEQGPYILSDRRFRDSPTVYYRYGAFRPRSRVEADGTRTHLVADGTGKLVPDRRGVVFGLPEGVEDPFAEPRAGGKPFTLPGFVIDSSVRYTNAGGTYRGHEVATGRRVFLKEARPHTGLRDDDATAIEQLAEEWAVLNRLHELAPGLAPEPIGYFRAWEHEFMAVEHVDGLLLSRWLALHHPILRAGGTEADFAAYYERCQRILAAIGAHLDRLHALGHIFVDVSPANILVGDDDRVRLIDFGSVHRRGDVFLRAGTPGYVPPQRLAGDDPGVYDEYGLASIALHLLGPLNLVADRCPGVLAHAYRDLTELAPVPAELWRQATRFRGSDASPTPEEVAGDPIRYLGELRDRTADALIAMADLDHPTRVFPTIPSGYARNTVCLAYGTAGVVHSLRRLDRPLPAGLLERLRRDAHDSAPDLGPGLFTGTAGLARVLADAGLLDDAEALLANADGHPLTGTSATLSGGSAGVALTHLALYGHTGDERHVDRALALAAALPADDRLTGLIGADDATGLAHGRAGVALMLAQLGELTGDRQWADRAVRLLHAELDRAIDPAAAGLLFPLSAGDPRARPYLFAGSAGMVIATTRTLRAIPDERLTGALPRLLEPLRLTYTVMPGLFQGLAGYVFTLADHGSRDAAVRAARSLYKYAVPHPTGVRFPGDMLLRFSAELWSGSAGVLLALNHVLDPRPDALCTVDEVIARRLVGAAR